ncbi:MAG: type III-A CRISPR-associated protein Csm2 [Endomicrobiia bacterium]
MAINFWKDKESRQIDPELFSIKAEELAKDIDKEGRDDRNNAKKNKPSQIRKFYDEILKFKGIIAKEPNKFNELLPYIKILNAKAAYVMGRDLISNKFKDFIADSLKQVNDKDDFEVFASFFEAFMGYYKFYRPSEGGR